MAEHKKQNYMTIFWWLLALTLAELAVYFSHFPKLVFVILLICLAISKASLVAIFFMHLKFERRTLGLIAVTPVVMGTLIVSLVGLDLAPIPLRTAKADLVRAATSAPAPTVQH